MEEYKEYEKIEKHIEFSTNLFELDLKSRHIILQFNKNKSKGIRRSGTYIFEDKINTIYNNIINCSGLKRLRLYFCLQYFLDEMMYYDVKNTEQFFIEDNTYNISKMYFCQEEWINNISIQEYEFYKIDDLNMNEAMYLICYLKEFDNFLLKIESYIKAYKDISSIKSKLRDTIYRIRCRHNNIWLILIAIINNSL